jgi:hypothetical protein
MASKILVIVATGEKEKLLTALMYARNALKRKWLEDVKVFFFGPSEKLITSDPEVADAVLEIVSLGDSYACKAISDNQEISDKISDLGVRVEYVGSIISSYIKEGYVPMVW